MSDNDWSFAPVPRREGGIAGRGEQVTETARLALWFPGGIVVGGLGSFRLSYAENHGGRVSFRPIDMAAFTAASSGEGAGS